MRKTIYTMLFLLLCMAANADNSVGKNRANNQVCLKLASDTVKYYNTSALASVTIDGNIVTVTDLAAVSDVFDNEVSEISFAKSSEKIAINIAYNGSSATVTGDTDVVTVAQQGADVTVTSTVDSYMEITLSGQTNDGSLLVYSNKKYGIVLNGVSITNADGPAINNQCGKSLYVTTVEGTINTLTDGATYAEAVIDQKGTLFSEGQIYFNGSGTLTINGNAKNGIASDDYIVFESGSINVNVSATGTNGVKVNDGLEILGGTLGIIVKADGARGIKDDSYMTIVGGTTTITTSGDCLIETIEGVKDTTSCAGIKCDSIFTMTAGTLTVTSSGDGGKGINCAQNIELKGGTMTVSTTGSNEEGKPKAVKSDTGIVLSGGSFKATCKKSWACDNGIETENPAARVTIVGTPQTKTLEKRNMIVVF